MITATKFLTLIFPICRGDSKASRASQRQSEKSKPTAGAEVKNNTVKCGINLFEESEKVLSAKKPPAHV